MTNDILDLFPNASADFLARNPRLSGERPTDKGGAPDAVRPELEQRAATPAPRTKRLKAEDSERFLVRVTSFRHRLIDQDNLCEKYVVDCCRYAGILPTDDPSKTEIEICQVKIGKEEQERTRIEIFALNTHD